MRYLLDTNIIIYTMKCRPPQVAARFAERRADELRLSSISLAELHFGAAKSQQPAKALQAIANLGDALDIAPFDEAAAQAYTEAKRWLLRSPDARMGTLLAGLIG